MNKGNIGSRFDASNFSSNYSKDVTCCWEGVIPTVNPNALEATNWRPIHIFSSVLHEYLIAFLCLPVS